MSIKLLKSDEEIIKSFKSLKTFEDIALLLEISPMKLREILIIQKKTNYDVFTITKKNGGKRLIHRPKQNLSILQKKFSYVLSIIYNNHTHSHGFIKNRSIKTNASMHIKQRHVLNFDLNDFFNSIKFGRVRAMFTHYFGFNETVATTFANLCCHHKGFLPQGSATSPIISNIISFKLDKELQKLAKQNHCVFTRYADDITISTKKKHFPSKIAITDDSNVYISQQILKIVKSNGFSINDEKTRLKDFNSQLNVTGIKVNNKLNIDRRYIRRIRSILHCIEINKGDIQKAEKIFLEKYKFRQRKAPFQPNMFDVLRGMISHVGFIKGKQDPLFIKLASRFNECTNGNQPFIKLDPTSRLQQEEFTYVIPSLMYPYTLEGEGCSECYSTIGQGTGFLVKGIGLITNYHVLKEYIENKEMDFKHKSDIIINRSKYSNRKQYAEVSFFDEKRDIAILKVKDINIEIIGYNYAFNITSGQEVQLIGYPEYNDGMDISIKSGYILGERKSLGDGYQRYEISAAIFGGNSGGPVVNANNDVIAIAVKGRGIVPNEVIPINQAIDLVKAKT